MYKLQQITFKKELRILISAEHNRKCIEEINLLSYRRFSKTFQNDIPFKMFLLKMKKIRKFGLNFHTRMIQPVVLLILRRSS